MRADAPRPHRLLGLLALGVVAIALPPHSPARAASPIATVSPTGARLQITGASLADAIDALARAADFKVTYEGPRPAVMLFNTDIATPSVAQTLFRLLEGQNINYGVVLDLTGKKVTLLMVLGPPARIAAGASPASGPAARPVPFATPRGPRNDLPPVDDEPAEAVEPEPEQSPSPVPSPAVPVRPGGPVALPPSPFQVSPFGPRSPFGAPPGLPRPSPSPSP